MGAPAASGAPSSGLLALPYQLLIDGILDRLDVTSLVTLRATCRRLCQGVDDDIVWRRRIQNDFRFSLTSTARTKGWKSLYRGLADPELFTWGDYRNKRLGAPLRLQIVTKHDASTNQEKRVYQTGIPLPAWNVLKRVQCMPFPLRIHWRDAPLFDSKAKLIQANQLGAERRPHFDDADDQDDDGNILTLRRIEPEGVVEPRNLEVGVPVELHAGGWSFFSLTHRGQILAWGSSVGDFDIDAAHEGAFEAPTLLDLDGHTARSLSVGREHAVALLDDNSIYEWSRRWDRPAVHHLATLQRDLMDAEAYQIQQVEAGWNFTAVLLQSTPEDGRDISKRASRIVLWQTEWTNLLERRAWYETSRGAASEDVGASWSVTVPTVVSPTPPQPFVRIAAGDNFIVALGQEGDVFYLELPETRPNRDGTVAQFVQRSATALSREMYLRNTEWTRLDRFCNIINMEHTELWNKPVLQHLIADKVNFTHISAQFRSFAVYAPDAGRANAEQNKNTKKGAGIVLLGKSDQYQEPIVMEELQGADVIKVAHGDWHSGALTQDGRVLTWGSKSNGALGSWDAIRPHPGAQSMLDNIHLGNTSAQQGPAAHAGIMGGRVTGAFNRILRLRQQAAAALDNRPALDEEQEARDRQEAEQMVEAEKRRYLYRTLPEEVPQPTSVRFGFPRLGETRDGAQVTPDDDAETKHVFDIAFAGWHSGALAVDRNLLS